MCVLIIRHPQIRPWIETLSQDEPFLLKIILYSNKKLTGIMSDFNTGTQNLEVKNITQKNSHGYSRKNTLLQAHLNRVGVGVGAYSSCQHWSDSGLASEVCVLEPQCQM